MSDHGQTSNCNNPCTDLVLPSVTEPAEPTKRYDIEVNIFDAIRSDLQEREAKGVETYGTRLRMFNGRDPLWDAYEEVLDLAAYLRQHLSEQLLLKEVAITTRTLRSDAAFRVSHEQIVDGLSRRGFVVVNPESGAYTFMSLNGGTPVVIPWNSTQLREQLSTIAIKEAAKKLCMDEVDLFLEMFNGEVRP